jgi:cysteinyl-tRNA synthetase
MILYQIRFYAVFITALVVVIVLSVAPIVHAQVKIQGIPVALEHINTPMVYNATLIDYREEMRKLVQSISEYGKLTKPDFVVVAKNGLDLLIKRNIYNDKITPKARAYMRAIDGIMQESMFFSLARGGKLFGSPQTLHIQTRMLHLADYAKKSGLKVLTHDFGNGNEAIDNVRKLANDRGFLSLMSNVPSQNIRNLPSYPSRPPKENSNNIISFGMIQNYAVIRDSASFGLESEFALKMHDTNYDALLVEVFHGDVPLSRQAVETLKYKKLGSRRMVLAYMDVGRAASYHYYWGNNWTTGYPSWIEEPLNSEPDHYRVKFWDKDWQNIITGNENSYLYGIIAQGFDGVVIDGADSYKYYEGIN